MDGPCQCECAKMVDGKRNDGEMLAIETHSEYDKCAHYHFAYGL